MPSLKVRGPDKCFEKAGWPNNKKIGSICPHLTTPNKFYKHILTLIWNGMPGLCQHLTFVMTELGRQLGLKHSNYVNNLDFHSSRTIPTLQKPQSVMSFRCEHFLASTSCVFLLSLRNNSTISVTQYLHYLHQRIQDVYIMVVHWFK